MKTKEIKQIWSRKEAKAQIHSSLYQRFLASVVVYVFHTAMTDTLDTDTPLSCDMSLTCPIRSHKARLLAGCTLRTGRHFSSKTVSDTAYSKMQSYSTVYIVPNSSPTCPYLSLNLWAFSRPNTAYSNYRKLDSVA